MAVQKKLVFFPERRVTAILSNAFEVHPAKFRSSATEFTALRGSLSSRKKHKFTADHNFHSEPVLWKIYVLDSGGGRKEIFLPEMPSFIFINHSKLKGWAEM